MTNRDMLLDFSRVVEVFKAENDICAVPTLLPLNSVLSVDLLEWFGKFFRFQAHKSWLESVCHIQIQRQSHGVKSLQISENSFVHLANVALLTGLDDFYSHRPAVSASASVPPAIAATAPSVIDVDPPLIVNQPAVAVAVAACASQPVTNLAMLAHFGDLLLVFKKQRKWSSAKESVPLAHVTNSEDVSRWFGKYFRSQKHKIWLEHQCFISILGRPHGLRLIDINADLRINLINTRGLLRLSSAVVCYCKGICKAKFNLVRTRELEHFCRPAVSLYRIVIISQHEIAVNECKVVYQVMCSCQDYGSQ